MSRERRSARRSERKLRRLCLNSSYSEIEFSRLLGIKWKFRARV